MRTKETLGHSDNGYAGKSVDRFMGMIIDIAQIHSSLQPSGC